MAREVDSFNRDKLLGQGRYGVVFEDIWNEKPVAVKRIELVDIASNKLEEEALQRLDHPNVIKLLHAKSDANFRYFYLELCDASLEKLFLKEGKPGKYKGPMPPTLTVLYQLALGLEYIHKMGLVHRDLKPENVLIWVDPKKRQVLMKWADFGLSKTVNERGSFSMSGIKGTLEWLAPEILKLLDEEESDQIENGTSTNRGTIQSDVFTEGLVFGYFLLDGRHIFGLRHQIQSNILENKPINLEKIKSKYSRDLILEMLKESVADRITSSEVAEELKKIKIELETKLFNLFSSDTYPSLEEIKQILQQGVDLNYTNKKGLASLLFLATEKMDGHNNLVEVIQLLIENGVEVNRKTSGGWNVLLLLSRYSKKENLIEVIRILIEHGIEINCKTSGGWNSLHFLCLLNQNENVIEIIKYLIQHGIEVNSKTNNGSNALTLLCEFYHSENLIEIIQLLIENGIEIDCRTNCGWNALTLLCKFYQNKNLIEILQLLIRHGIEVNYQTSGRWNALLLLSRYYQKENLIKIIKFLIENEIEINCKNDDGWNVLLLLCQNYQNENSMEIIQMLIRHGVDVNCKNTYGSNALTLLCEFYQKENLIEIIQLLIQHGIEVDCKISNGPNALTLLCEFNQTENFIEIVQLLTRSGCDVTNQMLYFF